MAKALARVASVAMLCLACAPSTPTTAPEQASPPSSTVAPPPEPEPAVDEVSAERVCERVWALISADLSSNDLGGFEEGLARCVADVEAERLEIGEDEYQRQAACIIAARTAAELDACEPAGGDSPGDEPSPAASAEPPPEGALTVPVLALMDLAMYSPNPDQKALQQTKAARFDKADGLSVVGFCVEPNGKTSHIRTIRKFPDDPQIDAIIRETISRWRFKPYVVDGVAVLVCTEKSFKLKFK